jgi:hypothetical protein
VTDTGTPDRQRYIERLRRLADIAPARALHTLAALRVADELAAGPLTIRRLAGRVSADPDRLERLLRAGEVIDVVARDASGNWALTPAGQVLVSDAPDSPHAELADDSLFAAWTRFADTVRGGQPCYRALFGESVFDRLSRTEDSRRAFHQHMYARAHSLYAPLLGLPVWPSTGVVVDVCGGTGGLLDQLLGSRPGLSGVLHDRPEVLELVPRPADGPLGRRVDLAHGDVFDGVPSGHDTYLLASVLHDWPDDDAARILLVCRAAMPAHARLLVVERVLPEHGKNPGVFSDLWMMAMVGGRERSAADWNSLLKATGFRAPTMHTAAGTAMAVLECRAE